ncbi:hypothetical protein [Bartonella queenslandensis]|uniref:hypothetical protein n=1 Tax=Bartonella queenslandensis TaxID=481138 RepID=UPI000A02CAE9|nr:hypothetical protein [Bartonella queenslandensis]
MDKCIKMMANNTISIRVPIQIKRCGGKKMLILPEGCQMPQPHEAPKQDETLVTALAKAYYWQKLIDMGRYKSIDDMSRQRNINASYISRILRLNQLAPQIKKAILDGTQPRQLTLQDMQTPFPDLWEDQLKHFGFA